LQQLFSSSALVFIGLMVRIVLLLLFEVLAARYLGPAQYGLFSLAFTVIVVLSSIPVLGLQNSLRRFISLNIEKEQLAVVGGLTTFGLIWPLVWGVILAVGILMVARSVSDAVFGKAEMGALVAALAFVIPLWSLRRLSTVIYSGYKKTAYKVLVEDVTEPVLRVAVMVAVAAFGWSLTELAFGTLGAYVIVGLLAIVLVQRSRRAVVGCHAATYVPARELLAFSAPLVVSELAEVILAWVSVLMLGLLSAEFQVGLFKAASQPPMLASAILTSFAFIYLPIATELYARQDLESWQTTNNAIVRWTMSLAFPIGVVCIAIPADVIGLLFGDAFVVGARAMQFLAAAYLFHAACGFTGLNLIVAGNTGIQMFGALLGLTMNIVFAVLWIPEFGASGAAAAVLISVIARNCYNLFFMHRLLQIMPFDRRYWAVLAVQTITAALLVLTSSYMGLAGLSAIVYVGVLQLPVTIVIGWQMGMYTHTDVKWAHSILQRLSGSYVR
jgi:O-antigen/teichoic acid export membrane protein